MSTRSEIAIEMQDKSIKSIYCHSDGYLEYNGLMLQTHYNTFEKAESIINENDCSILKSTIKESRFYNTWRNENTKYKEFDNESLFMDRFSNDIFAEYIYLFKNDKWHFSILKFLDNPKDNYSYGIGYHTKFVLLKDYTDVMDLDYIA
jgi:hypothetical protein|tara:strand:- start:566 stop:1009 length:444 start_codon:yes stop_codon:yes gene_type:complete